MSAPEFSRRVVVATAFLLYCAAVAPAQAQSLDTGPSIFELTTATNGTDRCLYVYEAESQPPTGYLISRSGDDFADLCPAKAETLAQRCKAFPDSGICQTFIQEKLILVDLQGQLGRLQDVGGALEEIKTSVSLQSTTFEILLFIFALLLLCAVSLVLTAIIPFLRRAVWKGVFAQVNGAAAVGPEPPDITEGKPVDEATIQEALAKLPEATAWALYALFNQFLTAFEGYSPSNASIRTSGADTSLSSEVSVKAPLGSGSLAVSPEADATAPDFGSAIRMLYNVAKRLSDQLSEERAKSDAARDEAMKVQVEGGLSERLTKIEARLDSFGDFAKEVQKHNTLLADILGDRNKPQGETDPATKSAEPVNAPPSPPSGRTSTERPEAPFLVPKDNLAALGAATQAAPLEEERDLPGPAAAIAAGATLPDSVGVSATVQKLLTDLYGDRLDAQDFHRKIKEDIAASPDFYADRAGQAADIPPRVLSHVLATFRVLDLRNREDGRKTGEEELRAFVRSALGGEFEPIVPPFGAKLVSAKHDPGLDKSASFSDRISVVVKPGLARGDVILLKASVLLGA